MTLLIPTLYRYITIQKIINKIFKHEDLMTNLSNIFKVEFKRDWVNRVWCLLNPYVQNMNDINGDVVSIYAYDKDGNLNNDVAIERWVMAKMNIAREFITNNNLFEILSYDIKKIDDDNNYLFIIENIYFPDLVKCLKRLGKILLSGSIVTIIALILFLVF